MVTPTSGVNRPAATLIPEFRPELTPAEMLHLGVFCGKYMTDCRDEFPKSWFVGAKLSAGRRESVAQFFRRSASQPLSLWRHKGWIHSDDPRGWFQWYCRYFRAVAWARMAPNRSMESHAPARSPDTAELRAGTPDVPTTPTAGSAPMGVRQPRDLAGLFRKAFSPSHQPPSFSGDGREIGVTVRGGPSTNRAKRSRRAGACSRLGLPQKPNATAASAPHAAMPPGRRVEARSAPAGPADAPRRSGR